MASHNHGGARNSVNLDLVEERDGCLHYDGVRVCDFVASCRLDPSNPRRAIIEGRIASGLTMPEVVTQITYVRDGRWLRLAWGNMGTVRVGYERIVGGILAKRASMQRKEEVRANG